MMFIYLFIYLFHVQYQSLEVFALGVIDIYRVVGRLCELVQDAYVALCHGRCCEYSCTEILLAHDL